MLKILDVLPSEHKLEANIMNIVGNKGILISTLFHRLQSKLFMRCTSANQLVSYLSKKSSLFRIEDGTVYKVSSESVVPQDNKPQNACSVNHGDQIANYLIFIVNKHYGVSLLNNSVLVIPEMFFSIRWMYRKISMELKMIHANLASEDTFIHYLCTNPCYRVSDDDFKFQISENVNSCATIMLSDVQDAINYRKMLRRTFASCMGKFK